MSTICETTLRVRYAESDQMGVVYHANYLVWFEVGRVELLRQLGFSYLEMEAEGMHTPVVELQCRYKHPARFDDLITIRTRLAQMRTSLLRFQYEIVRTADGRVLAEGVSVHVVVGADLKRTHLTEKYRQALRAAAETSEPAAPSCVTAPDTTQS
jgi:acyl-CoA thioester hydrolase